MIKVAAFQAPYSRCGVAEAIGILERSVVRCEREGVDILCTPEAFLDGLADYADRPNDIAIHADNGDLEKILSPLASESVATIVGFTEANEEKLYNSAAVYYRGKVVGIYRKMRPATRRSIYSPGEELQVFEVKGLKFGIQICNDSNFPEQTAELVARGARVLFIPSNNALPHAKADVVQLAREIDRSLAVGNSIYVVRADVAGTLDDFTAYGTSKIIDPTGNILSEAAMFEVDLLNAMIADVAQVTPAGRA